jgi:hypothetical protein
MFRSRRPARDESWDAVVVDKSRGMSDGSNLYRYVTIRFADDTSRKIRVDKDLWNSLDTGDRVSKRAGENPVKAG